MSEVKLLHFSNTMIARVAFLCAALVAVRASGLIGAPLINTGVSTSARQQDVLGNNAFGYTIKDGLGATNSRSEVGDGYGNRKGSYTITDIDGRARRVDYVADGHGFRATVKTNEPGTAASAPAAALINSPYAGPVAPVVNHVAPAAIAAPMALAAPAIGYGGIGVGAIAAPVAYGGVIGHGAALGLGYGAGILGAGIGKALI
ncbi:adult-specific rigid cuticular protein 15.7 [Caerostris darwini]|uniref:Adult-specific rigid cuticular protein 15.7 n=1 Tax=Caerostris darwini TaxID=1538125 RepID=A0AAV4UWH5_9ARAC|nr:adult-specific rigid cuticular protein 15.7 [Caerostris darwini]